MGEKKAFISSTRDDLREYRQAVRMKIDVLDGWKWEGMERFGARPQRTPEFCRRKVGECDVFVGILGLCYGSCPKGCAVSYTEMEYDAAGECGKDRLMFLSGKDFAPPQQLKLSAEEATKQRAFRERAKEECVYELFSNPDELGGQVVTALVNWKGTQESGASGAASVQEEVVKVHPPGGPSGDLWMRPGKQTGEMAVGPDEGYLVWMEPGGRFKMGGMWRDARPYEKPVHDVVLTRGFRIGQCQVTNAQYAHFLKSIEWTLDEEGYIVSSDGKRLFRMRSVDSEIGIAEDGTCTVAPGRKEHPVVSVSWYGATAYAKHHKLRLPTEAEWEYVARGPKKWWWRWRHNRYNRYPWGNRWNSKMCCNKFNEGPSVEDFARTFPVGSFPRGASWCGALDMIGNVWECCSDLWEDYDDSPTEDPRRPDEGSLHVTRGCSWAYGQDHYSTTTHRHGDPPELTNSSLGFRCAYTPKSEAVGEES